MLYQTSGTVNRYRFVSLNRSKVSEGGQSIIGISGNTQINEPTPAGYWVDVFHGVPFYYLELAEGASADDYLTSDGEGKGIQASDWAWAVALEDGLAGDVIRVLLCPRTLMTLRAFSSGFSVGFA